VGGEGHAEQSTPGVFPNGHGRKTVHDLVC